MKFIRNTKYYTGIVYEWNLPAGHTCPFAKECKVCVNRETGKFEKHEGAFRCYAAAAERFPGVREHRWKNFEFVRNGGIPVLPAKAKHIRLHGSGDFFNEKYFLMWVQVAKDNPDVNIWTFTKSINYWVKHINDIPNNLILTASYGGKYDHLIEEYDLKSAKVFSTIDEINAAGLPVDVNDDWARVPDVKFGLLDNYYKPKVGEKIIVANDSGFTADECYAIRTEVLKIVEKSVKAKAAVVISDRGHLSVAELIGGRWEMTEDYEEREDYVEGELDPNVEFEYIDDDLWNDGDMDPAGGHGLSSHI